MEKKIGALGVGFDDAGRRGGNLVGWVGDFGGIQRHL